jgi:hypothetical protein
VPTENITAPLGGQASVDYDLLLPNGPVQLLNGMARFMTAKLEENVYGYAQTDIGIRTISPDYADRILKELEGKGTPLARFRLGIGVPDHMHWTPWQLHCVANYRGFFEGVGKTAGHQINLHTEDLLAMYDRSTRTAAYHGKVSDIVHKIADQNNIIDTVIEPTSTEGGWIQPQMGDFEFVRKRLVRVARSTRGRGNYLFFMRDNVLHFHSVDYQADVKHLTYYNTGAIRLEMLDLAQEKLEAGSAGVRLIGHDPYTGQSQEAASRPGDAIRFSNWISGIGNLVGAARKFPFHLGVNRGLEALNIMQNMYEAARQESYQLRLTVRKTNPMRAGNIVNLVIEPKTGQASTWTGFWLVAHACHVVKKGDLTSTYLLQRGELSALKGVSNALASQGIEVVADQQNAPGVDLNLQQTQVSELTTGAGKAIGSGVYLTVQDAHKAPTPATPVIPRP